METNKEKTSLGDKINDFIQKNRKGIFISLGVIVAAVAGLIAWFLISDSVNKKAIAAVEELSAEYERLHSSGNSDYYSAEMDVFLAKIQSFADNKRGFPGSKAWSIIGHIYSDRGQWAQAEEAWLKSAQTGEKTYLGPIAYFQAAVAAEEQSKLEKAIEYLEKCVSHNFEFPDGPRAQFNIGRLYEQLGNYNAALDAYRDVMIKWPWERPETISQNMLIWQNLARNQIIKLEVR